MTEETSQEIVEDTDAEGTVDEVAATEPEGEEVVEAPVRETPEGLTQLGIPDQIPHGWCWTYWDPAENRVVYQAVHDMGVETKLLPTRSTVVKQVVTAHKRTALIPEMKDQVVAVLTDSGESLSMHKLSQGVAARQDFPKWRYAGTHSDWGQTFRIAVRGAVESGRIIIDVDADRKRKGPGGGSVWYRLPYPVREPTRLPKDEFVETLGDPPPVAVPERPAIGEMVQATVDAAVADILVEMRAIDKRQTEAFNTLAASLQEWLAS